MQLADGWRGAALYQIYPRSFQDRNDDGVGNLQEPSDLAAPMNPASARESVARKR